MNTPPSPKTSLLAVMEAWWAFTARVLFSLFGAFLVYRQQLPPPGVDLAVMAAAVGCMGPVIGSTVASLIEAARGTLRL